MKTSLLIVLAVTVIAAGGGLAMLNNACKSGHHPWCSPTAHFRHHASTADL
jgi:hypothetical protein